MRNRIQQLGADTVIYGVGDVLAKGVGFLLLPIYTRLFTPVKYGTIEMLTVISGFLGAFLNLGLGSSQSFYFFEQKGRGRKAQGAVITAILRWRLLWGGIIVLSATLLSPLLRRLVFPLRFWVYKRRLALRLPQSNFGRWKWAMRYGKDGEWESYVVLFFSLLRCRRTFGSMTFLNFSGIELCD